jgi:hypothetical protein
MSDLRESKQKVGGFFCNLFICVGLFFGLSVFQNDIHNYKSVVAHANQAIMLDANSIGPIQSDFAFVQGIISARSLPRETLASVPVNGAVAVQTVSQNYECRSSRRGRSCSWKTSSRHFTTGEQVQVGKVSLQTILLENYANEVWERQITSADIAAVLQKLPELRYKNDYLYRTEYSRSYHRTIAANKTVTVVGAVYGGDIKPSPLMKPGYSAIWPGEMTPEKFEATLAERLRNTFLAAFGLITMGIWLALVLLQDIFFRNRNLSGSFHFASAAAGSATGLIFFFVAPNFLLAGGIILGIALLGFVIGPQSTPRKEI